MESSLSNVIDRGTKLAFHSSFTLDRTLCSYELSIRLPQRAAASAFVIPTAFSPVVGSEETETLRVGNSRGLSTGSAVSVNVAPVSAPNAPPNEICLFFLGIRVVTALLGNVYKYICIHGPVL